MTNNKTKKLTMANINKENSKLHEMKAVTITLDNGSSYSIDIYKKITPSMIDQTYADVVNFMAAGIEQGTDQVAISAVTTQYMMLSFIEQATSLKLPSELDKRLVNVQKFYDLGLLQKIIAQFDEEEAEKAFNKLAEMINEYHKQVDVMHQEVMTAVKEHEENEQVLWEAGEEIAQINELDESGNKIENEPPISDEEMDKITKEELINGDE